MITNEEAKKIIYNQWQAFLDDNIDYAGISEAYKMAMKALEQQPCEDAVSRSELMKLYKEWQPRLATNVCEFEQALEDLPLVYPERPKGKWIEVEVRNVYATLKCSVCGRVIEPFFDFCKYSYEDIKRSYPYCHCGAEMKGEENV